MSKGRCILAIGPNDIASMEYFTEQKAAIICNTEDEILTRLQNLIENPTLQREMATNARICGEKNHNADMIKKIFFNKVLGDKL